MNQLDINAQFGQRSMPGNQMMLKQLAKDKEIAMKLRHQEMMKQVGCLTCDFIDSIYLWFLCNYQMLNL